MQTGESINQAQVFKAHAVPQFLCGNLIHALELLANQQEDGDGLMLNVCDKLRRGGAEKDLYATACVNSSRLTMSASLMIGHLTQGMGTIRKYEGRKFQKGAQR